MHATPHIESEAPVKFGRGATPFGDAEIAWTSRGVALLSFPGETPTDVPTALRARFPKRPIERSDEAAAAKLDEIFHRANTRLNKARADACGTPFQQAVWEAVRDTQPGDQLTYADLAARIGRPRAARAVGRALAANTIAFVVPCHRVLPAAGGPGQYRWGPERKRAMLAWERNL